MSFPWLRTTLVLALGTLSPLAWAGSSGSSGSSDTGGSGTGGSDTGGSDTGGTTSEGSSSGEICGECTPSADPVQIISPADGAVVPRTFDVRVTAPHTCSCETMCCNTLEPASVNLRIDGMTVDNCNTGDCDTTDHTFTVVDLAPGTYLLDAAAPVDFSVEFSAKIMITVEGEIATGDTTAGSDGNVSAGMTAGNGTTSTGGSGGETTPATGEPTGGCGCRSEPGPRGALASMLGLLALGAVRRRRR
ncbi:MAG: MYXO-CTERM sorting domain-containing protein [Myxococcales bacterium]|nr:MYXO-CTERM sorting domain-containing protein [Myxococcales bacterium]